jgi:hypothetical protein
MYAEYLRPGHTAGNDGIVCVDSATFPSPDQWELSYVPTVLPTVGATDHPLADSSRNALQCGVWPASVKRAHSTLAPPVSRPGDPQRSPLGPEAGLSFPMRTFQHESLEAPGRGGEKSGKRRSRGCDALIRRYMYGFLEKKIQTPMARGRSTK